ncbi:MULTISPECIES: site-2 protease family protein [Tissierellales]|jgi:Zn-dependent protease|uniref:Site-2 protease family protein n=1 Tax=Acidilutibacter cellobiosedens TaxID=2507161 RepID=A0A410QCL5_9FIRM|nr:MULTISPECIES: site-2 protease family protein [Tissierellales]QAT61736.1 site-2 protease family protein [Acidilutibacter cellobiosedens]SCL82491.1 Zn-dependent proteases [Sporanaerobacter sp. PP17-6a]
MIADKLIILPGLLTAIVFHEFAHGFVAYKLGDPTAKNAGRLTLNPFKHIDLIGFIFLMVFRFGWAKPVPINPNYFKNRKKDTILVSAAGPIINFIIALFFSLIVSMDIIHNNLILNIVIITIWYNIMLGLFNLLPLPPLDGSKVLASMLPDKYEYYFYKYEKYLYIILLLLIVTGLIDKILSPLINIVLNIMVKIIN